MCSYKDVAKANYANDTTGTITLINTIAQGTTVSTRVGKKVLLGYVGLKGFVRALASTVVTEARNMVVYDRRPTGALPSITDILTASTTFAFNNDNNEGRFEILEDWCFPLSALGSGFDIAEFNAVCPVNAATVYKAAGTGVIADISEGALYFVTVGTDAGAAGAQTEVGIRVYYEDIN